MSRRLVPVVLLLPGIAGMVFGAAFEAKLFPASIFVFHVQIATGTFAILLSSLWIIMVLLALWLTGQQKASIARARTEERLAQAEAHRRFVRRLNHELKNPLTAVRAGLANLVDGGVHEVSAQASVHNMRQQVERLGRLANDLRKLADIETGEIERAPVDMTEIIEEAVEMARSVPGRAEARVTVNVQRLPWPLSQVPGDRDLLLLAVYNLLDNALKFSDSEAEVEVRASEDGTRATIEVADAGRGISAEDLPHVAEELYRGQGAQGIEGSGLGLALVERIAGLHGGGLAIRSREGQGTVAMLRLSLIPTSDSHVTKMLQGRNMDETSAL
ncbi:MAG: HAMP domain-containing histidine kinase [Chloroflexi bacterium]|nr:HAMP domain-containing histidine kinase [Chloroflexota bacterium]MDA8187544.1 HAMP domain-containing sensor histidine kinase [Dehalococcoidales bacterium]